ncbi:MAG: hypothetical protein IIY21_04495 [Clostridiales bacterium]|nr:hypothetical protein [Clostridiales bacterium]MBQ1573854.1 hypothetical protein [Clostridiales bacterium]
MKTLKQLYDRAYDKNPKRVMDLEEVYQYSDMSMHEFVAHLRIIAEED